MELVNPTGDASLLCTLHSDDANGQAANLVNWQQEYDQLSHGHFRGLIREINFEHMHVFREETNRALRQQCLVEEGGLWLGFSADEKSCHINNEKTSSSRILCRPGSRDFELLTPENFSIFGIVLHQSMFRNLSEREQFELPKAQIANLWLGNVPNADLANFKQYLSILLHAGGNRWSEKTQERILLDAVVDLLAASFTEKHEKVSSCHRQRIVQRVKDILAESDYKTPVTVAELCEKVYVSRRTLQYTFQACCGMSPKQFIHVVRLNQIRRVFQHPDETRTVSDIAFEFGFFHLGQFSHDYKKLFGETPAQTLVGA